MKKSRKAPQPKDPRAKILEKAGNDIAAILTKHNLRLFASFTLTENQIIPNISIKFVGQK